MTEERKGIDLKALPEDRQKNIMAGISKRIAQNLKNIETEVSEINRILNVYNMKFEVVWNILDKDVNLMKDKAIKLDLADKKPEKTLQDVIEESKPEIPPTPESTDGEPLTKKPKAETTEKPKKKKSSKKKTTKKTKKKAKKSAAKS